MIEARQLVSILSMFLIVQFGGLLVAIYALGPLQAYVGMQVSAGNSVADAFYYLIYIVAGAVVILLMFRFLKSRTLFMLLEAFVVLLSTSLLLFIIITTALPAANLYYIAAVSGLVAIALIAIKNRTSRLRNILAITSSMGVGIIIGLDGFAFAYAFMLLMVVYDYIAVFVTKHMQVLAQHASSMNLALLVGSSEIEAIPSRYLARKDARELGRDLRKQKIKDPVIKGLIQDKVMPVISQVQLGSGDLAIPLMVAVSASVSFLSYFAGMMVAIGAACGMLYTMYLLKKYKTALPAIPPLSAFINLSLGAMFIITDFAQPELWAGFIILGVLTVLIITMKLRSMQSVRTTAKRL
jgi:presenilin-like A22 family membrane protease